MTHPKISKEKRAQITERVIKELMTPVVWVTNAVSLNMVDWDDLAEPTAVNFFASPISKDEMAARINTAEKVCVAIGHADTARVVSGDLGVELLPQRTQVVLRRNGKDVILVAQYVGPRLPEGATELPEGATIRYFYVDVRFVRLP